MKDTLLTIDDIAKRFGTSRRNVAERWVHKPDFPAPRFAPTRRTRLWLEGDIRRWGGEVLPSIAPLDEGLDIPWAEILFCAMNARADYEDGITKAAHAALAQARRRAGRRGREMALSLTDIDSMLSRQDFKCAVSGRPFSLEVVSGSKVRPYAPSIDRIDSAAGYTSSNARLVCVAVNYMMNTWGDAVFHGIRGQ